MLHLMGDLMTLLQTEELELFLVQAWLIWHQRNSVANGGKHAKYQAGPRPRQLRPRPKAPLPQKKKKKISHREKGPPPPLSKAQNLIQLYIYIYIYIN